MPARVCQSADPPLHVASVYDCGNQRSETLVSVYLVISLRVGQLKAY